MIVLLVVVFFFLEKKQKNTHFFYRFSHFHFIVFHLWNTNKRLGYWHLLLHPEKYKLRQNNSTYCKSTNQFFKIHFFFLFFVCFFQYFDIHGISEIDFQYLWKCIGNCADVLWYGFPLGKLLTRSWKKKKKLPEWQFKVYLQLHLF